MPRKLSMVGKPPLGTLIAVRLKEMDKTAAWLAKEADVNHIRLCAVMAGRANPTIKYLRKIAKSLGIDVKVLVNALLCEG